MKKQIINKLVGFAIDTFDLIKFYNYFVKDKSNLSFKTFVEILKKLKK